MKFVCNTCGNRYSRKDYLNRHLLNHGEKTHICNTCGKRYTRRDYLSRHLLSHKEKTHICNLCPKEFWRKDHLQKHKAKAHRLIHKKKFIRSEKKTNNCNTSGEEFSREDHLKTHGLIQEKTIVPIIDKLSEKKPSVSDTCDEEFASEDNLKKHQLIHKETDIPIMDELSGKMSYVCNTCGRKYSRKSYFTKHLRIHGEKTHISNLSHKNFWRNDHLKVHKFTHKKNISKKHGVNHEEKFIRSRKKANVCNTCGERYFRTDNFRKHLLSHGEKTNIDIFCHKKFPGNNVNNQLTHKSYVCEVCNKQFSRKVHLNKHRLIHTRGKFICGFCEKDFDQKSYLYKHSVICNSRNTVEHNMLFADQGKDDCFNNVPQKDIAKDSSSPCPSKTLQKIKTYLVKDVPLSRPAKSIATTPCNPKALNYDANYSSCPSLFKSRLKRTYSTKDEPLSHPTENIATTALNYKSYERNKLPTGQSVSDCLNNVTLKDISNNSSRAAVSETGQKIETYTAEDKPLACFPKNIATTACNLKLLKHNMNYSSFPTPRKTRQRKKSYIANDAPLSQPIENILTTASSPADEGGADCINNVATNSSCKSQQNGKTMTVMYMSLPRPIESAATPSCNTTYCEISNSEYSLSNTIGEPSYSKSISHTAYGSDAANNSLTLLKFEEYNKILEPQVCVRNDTSVLMKKKFTSTDNRELFSQEEALFSYNSVETNPENASVNDDYTEQKTYSSDSIYYTIHSPKTLEFIEYIKSDYSNFNICDNSRTVLGPYFKSDEIEDYFFHCTSRDLNREANANFLEYKAFFGPSLLSSTQEIDQTLRDIID